MKPHFEQQVRHCITAFTVPQPPGFPAFAILIARVEHGFYLHINTNRGKPMRRIIVGILAVSLSIATLTGCNTIGKENTGMLIGGVGGGALGSAVTGGSATGAVVGAVGGAFAGRAIASHSNY